MLYEIGVLQTFLIFVHMAKRVIRVFILMNDFINKYKTLYKLIKLRSWVTIAVPYCRRRIATVKLERQDSNSMI